MNYKKGSIIRNTLIRSKCLTIKSDLFYHKKEKNKIITSMRKATIKKINKSIKIMVDEIS